MSEKIGQSGKSLHDLLGDLMKLKEKGVGLGAETAEARIQGAQEITIEVARHHQNLLKRWTTLKGQVFGIGERPDQHPWYGLVTGKLTAQGGESLIRQLRYLIISLNKVWVEIQTSPLFRQNIKDISIEELESLLLWLENAPDFTQQQIPLKAISELASPEGFRRLIEFVRDVRSLRLLTEQALKHFERVPEYRMTRSVCDRIEHWRLDSLKMNQLVDLIRIQESKKNELEWVIGFFAELSEKMGSFEPKTLSQAQLIFDSYSQIEALPKKLHGWLRESILGRSQRVKIDAWSKRAKPVLDMESRLSEQFDLGAATDPVLLREMASHLKTGGWFYWLNPAFRRAKTEYLSMRKVGTLGPDKIMRLEMASGLETWASYIEQSRQFMAQSEAVAIFESGFNGIHTDFSSALEVNQWAEDQRSALAENEAKNQVESLSVDLPESFDQQLEAQEEESRFKQNLLNALLDLTPERVGYVVNSFQSQQAAQVRRVLNERSRYLSQSAAVEIFDCLRVEAEKHADLEFVRFKLTQWGWKDHLVLGEVKGFEQVCDESEFLTARLAELARESEYLKNTYQGAKSDLAAIDRAIQYVRSIENSKIPETLKPALLTSFGPQRMKDGSAQYSLSIRKTIQGFYEQRERLYKVLGLIDGQVSDLEWPVSSLVSEGIVKLTKRIEGLIQVKALLPTLLDYLSTTSEIRRLGLVGLTLLMEKKEVALEQVDLWYQFSWYYSLLEENGKAKAGLTSL